ncbi:MAG: hypothetical protein ABSF70_12275 [Terracidiphilus sp.]|jgi:hypothetical protein
MQLLGGSCNRSKANGGLIAHIADRNKRGQAARKAGEPEVGIFFVHNGRVLTDSMPLCVAARLRLRQAPADNVLAAK